jgi:hypothetical protein
MAKMSKFQKLSNKIAEKQGVTKQKANAIAASIGRKKYGKTAFQEMAAKGKSKLKTKK